MKNITFSLFAILLLFTLSGCQKTNETTTEVKDGQYSKAEFTNTNTDIATTSEEVITDDADVQDNAPIKNTNTNEIKTNEIIEVKKDIPAPTPMPNPMPEPRPVPSNECDFCPPVPTTTAPGQIWVTPDGVFIY